MLTWKYQIKPSKPMNAAYAGSFVDMVLTSTDAWHKKQTGDLTKGVQLLYDIVTLTGQAEAYAEKLSINGLLRVPIGSDCVSQLEDKIKSLQESLTVFKELSVSTDFKDEE
jgi:hypothetical protein